MLWKQQRFQTLFLVAVSPEKEKNGEITPTSTALRNRSQGHASWTVP